MYCCFWFLIAFAIDDIHEKIKDIHSKIFIQFQNPHGLRIVRIPSNISKIANQNINQDDQSLFIFLIYFKI